MLGGAGGCERIEGHQPSGTDLQTPTSGTSGYRPRQLIEFAEGEAFQIDIFANSSSLLRGEEFWCLEGLGKGEGPQGVAKDLFNPSW